MWILAIQYRARSLEVGYCIKYKNLKIIYIAGNKSIMRIGQAYSGYNVSNF